jgi:hypothetical protein
MSTMIEGFSNYSIDEYGKVIDLTTNEIVKSFVNNTGYLYVTLRDEGNNKRLRAIHRLLAIAFLDPPDDESKVVINHIDGNKRNNSLNNLEWVTYKENCEHAGRIGISPKCLPVQVFDSKKHVAELFPSAREAGRRYGISKDAVLWRVKSDGKKVFSDGRQYRLASNDPWVTFDDVDREIRNAGNTRSLLGRNILTGELYFFPTITEAAEFLGLKIAAVSSRLSFNDQPIFWNYVQLKRESCNKKWRKVSDPHIAMENQNQLNRVIAVIDGDVVTLFNKLDDCSIVYGLKKTTLHYRLSNGDLRKHKDGLIYIYYRDLIKIQCVPPSSNIRIGALLN